MNVSALIIGCISGEGNKPFIVMKIGIAFGGMKLAQKVMKKSVAGFA